MQQSTEPDFAFHTLGWYQFQNLCATILTDVLGQTVQVAAAGKDAGIDALFQGTWVTQSGEAFTGSFVAQAKYSRYAGRAFSMATLTADLKKLAALVEQKLCDNYFVFTNYTISFQNKLAFEQKIREASGVKTATIFGPDQLTKWIRESHRLRLLVPRVYGLGDLAQIVDERARRQAVAILESFQSRLKTVVPTDAYRNAAIALDEHRFVLLIGDPMTGKTTISYALALAAVDSLEMSVFVVKSPDEFAEHWDPDDPKRFYWVDDAFGQTQFDPSLALEWNRQIDRVQAAIDRGARIVFTTRTYIWNDAATFLKRHAFPLFDNSQVHIYVERLTKIEKRQILYHHLRMGNQPSEFKRAVHPFLEELTNLRSFLPEAARRLGNSFFTRSLGWPIDKAALQTFFEEPLPILVDIIRQLDVASKALLAIMFSKGGSVPAPVAFDESDRATIELMGTTPAAVMSAVRALNENLIRRVVDLNGSASYVFTHPTVRDALAQITAETSDWLRIYLAGVDIKNALTEVTCGKLNLPGVKVIVPPSDFGRFLEKLHPYFQKYSGYKDGPPPQEFLATRCTRAFLLFALETRPDMFEERHTSYDPIASSPWLSLMGRLNEYGILPEDLRKAAVSVMANAGESDLSFLRVRRLSALFNDGELKDLYNTVAADGLPHLEEAIENLADNYDPSYGDVEDFFSTLNEYCDVAEELFADDPALLKFVSAARKRLQSAIEDLEIRYAEPEYDDDSRYGISRPQETDHGSRDVFEDVADPN